MNDFYIENEKQWAKTLKRVFPYGIPESARWTALPEIVSTLSKFTLKELNHTMFPNGGGNDIIKVKAASEPNCIELQHSGLSEIGRPSQLIFRHFPRNPRESFLLLELSDLSPSGTYENVSGTSEEVVLLPSGEYMDRSDWDSDIMTYDDSGSPTSFPKKSRIAIRYFRGKFLTVAKASIWNDTGATYDGRHSRMTSDEIHSAIGHAISRGSEIKGEYDPRPI